MRQPRQRDLQALAAGSPAASRVREEDMEAPSEGLNKLDPHQSGQVSRIRPTAV